MDAQSPLQPLPSGFHWEAHDQDATPRLAAVPDAHPAVCLATIRVGTDIGCVATIRQHRARAARVKRPFRTTAAASGWIARWLERQGRIIAAELAEAP